MSKESSKNIRHEVCKELKEVFEDYHQRQIGEEAVEEEEEGKDKFNPDGLVYEVEKAIYQDSIRVLVQSSDASWKPIYKANVSNLLFNLRQYEHSDKVIQRLIDNSKQEMTRILINGPLALNEELDQIKELRLQEGGSRVKYSSNTGGMVRCPTCHQTEVYRQLVQDRGGDEAFSSYYSCLNEECGRQWRRGG